MLLEDFCNLEAFPSRPAEKNPGPYGLPKLRCAGGIRAPWLPLWIVRCRLVFWGGHRLAVFWQGGDGRCCRVEENSLGGRVKAWLIVAMGTGYRTTSNWPRPTDASRNCETMHISPRAPSSCLKRSSGSMSGYAAREFALDGPRFAD